MVGDGLFPCPPGGKKIPEGSFGNAGHRAPSTHDLDLLADFIEANISPWDIREASLILTQYAVDARYPGTDIDEDEAREAVFHAESIHNWASRILEA